MSVGVFDTLIVFRPEPVAPPPGGARRNATCHTDLMKARDDGSSVYKS